MGKLSNTSQISEGTLQGYRDALAEETNETKRSQLADALYFMTNGIEGKSSTTKQIGPRSPELYTTPSTPAPNTPPPASPLSNWQYRPANQYQQYYNPLSSGGQYGRQPLRPYIPGVPSGSGRPSAASIIAGLGRAAPVGSPSGMATGGPVRGQGGGQQDGILTRAPPGNFIIPADIVAHLGDGSSNEGHRRLTGAFERMGYKIGGRVRMARGGVPVALSQDEFEVPKEAVTILGRGSYKQGEAMLHDMIKRVRAHKAKKGFPPAARSPLSYMKSK